MTDGVQQSDGGIQGQLSQISIELGKQSTALAVIETKLDNAINTGVDHESRIRSLEGVKAKLIGGATAAGLLSGGVATLLYWVLSQRH